MEVGNFSDVTSASSRCGRWLLFLSVFLFSFALVEAQINASFVSNRTQGCAPLVVVFTNTSTGQPESCEWDFGNGNQSAECGPLATFTSPGTYEVLLTIRKGTEVSTATRTITVFPDPVPDFDVSLDKGCFPLPVSFRDRSVSPGASISTWVWNLGDGRSSSQQNPQHTYLSSGNFDVTLIVTSSNGCRASIIKEDVVSVVPPPRASFTFIDSVACAVPFIANFQDASQSVQPLTYSWNFGDGGTSSLQSPAHQYNSAGDFPVRLEVTNEFGCKDDTIVSGSIKIETLSPAIELGDTIGCAPFETSYNALVNVPARSFEWAFGSELVSGIQSGTVMLEEPGIYPVTLQVISQNGCEASATKNIVVGRTPTAAFSASPQESCVPPLTVQFTNQSSGGSSFQWQFGNGATSSLENPVYTYNAVRAYSVRLTVTSDEGCTATLLKRDFIKIERPVLTIVSPASGGCIPFSTSFRVSQTGPGTIENVQWDFGNGSTFSGIIPPVQTYASTGTFTVRATVTFADGCAPQTITRRVTAGGPPTYAVAINPKEICANRAVTGSVTGGSGAQFTWNMGDGETVTGRNPIYTYRIPGTYTVRVTASNFGCEVSTNLGEIVVNPPNAAFSVSNLCGGLAVRFTNRSEGNTNALWDFGDGSLPLTNNNANVTHVFPAYGTYNVKLVVSNTVTGCVDSLTRLIDLRNDRPSVVLQPQIGCAPFTATLSDTSSNWRTVRWDLNGVEIQGSTVSLTVDNPGAYDVRAYTLDQQGCRDTFLFPAAVKAVKPEANFSFNPLGGCAPINVNFTDVSTSQFSTVSNWQWDFGGLGSSTQRNPAFSFSLTDTVPITLIVRDNLGCRDTVTNDLPVSFPKVLVAAPFNSICTGTPFQFVNNSLGVALRYQWDFGDGSPFSNERAPAHIYQTQGLYDVKLLITDDNDCQDSVLLPAFVKVENLSYDFDGDNRFRTCPELVTNFSIFPSNILYNQALWDFGDGSSSLDSNRFPTNIYNEAGIYDVSLILEDFRGCRDTIFKPEFIQVQGPRGSFTVTPDSGCAPLNVSIQAEFFGSKTNFWDFGDGVGLVDTLLQTSIAHTYQSPGRAQPSLVIDDGLGCIVIVRGPEVLMGNVVAQIEASSAIVCNEEELFLADTGRTRSFAPVVSWEWDFGDGNTASGQSVKYAYNSDETKDYWITVTTTNTFGCSDVDSFLVKVYKNPPLETTGDKVICLQDEVQLGASGVRFYEWFPKNTLSDPNIANPIARPPKTTEYVVLGYDIPSCPAYDTVLVRVVDRVVAEAGPDTSVCEGTEIQLFSEVSEINSGQFIYQWSPIDGLSDPQSSNPIALPETDIMYTVTVSNGRCRPAQIPVFIRVAPKPVLSVGESPLIFRGASIQLETATNQNVSYSWEPPLNLSCIDCPSPVASPSETISYAVTVTNAEGCSDTKELTVRVISLCDASVLKIPNVFSPNNDGLNDEFLLKGEGLKALKSMKIYSRTGQMVFESFDINKGWDGTFNGVRLNSGVYVYIIEAVCDNDESAVVNGNLTLLR
jgi:gliding motility-associated-like protein